MDNNQKKENTDKVMKKLIMALVGLASMLILVGAIIFKIGNDKNDQTEKVNAFIYVIDDSTKGDNVYLIYSYKKKLYENIPYKGKIESTAKVGDLVQIRVYKENPKKIYFVNLIVIGILVMAVGIVLLILTTIVTKKCIQKNIIKSVEPDYNSYEGTFDVSKEEIEVLMQDYIHKFQFQYIEENEGSNSYYRAGDNIIEPYIYFSYEIIDNNIILDIWDDLNESDKIGKYNVDNIDTMPVVVEFKKLIDKIGNL